MKLNKIDLTFCVFLLFLVIFKLVVLVSLPEELVNNVEWIEKGTLTRDLIEGLIMPISDYQFSHREGFHFIVGILAVPFYLFFGKTSFAFHLVGIAFSVGTFIGWYYLFNTYFNKRTTHAMSLLYIFAPPYFTRFTVLTTATHNEVNFFIILFTIQFFKIFFSNKNAIRLRSFILLGVIGAAGVWLCYSFIIIVITCLLLWFISGKKFINKSSFWIFISIVSFGMYPLLYDVFLPQGIIQDLFFNKDLFVGNIDVSMGSRLVSVLFQHIPQAIGFQRYIISILNYGIVVLLCIFLA